MTTATAQRRWTAEDLLAMPEDGIERWIVNGELREAKTRDFEDQPLTVRNRNHSETLVSAAYVLKEWSNRQPLPRGKVYGGEAGVRLARDPDLTCGADLLSVSAEVVARQTNATTMIEGIPILVLEITSPSDTDEDLHEKIDSYLNAGVALVWSLHPRRRTVTIYRPDAEPQFVNTTEELSAELHLPGFRVPVSRLFE